MVDPVVTGALIWLVQRLLDKGVDRIFDAAFDRQPQPTHASAPVVAARRHDLSVEGAQGTSDVDVDVRHHLPPARVPVILTFQKFGTTAGGTTFPMVLGDTAHLTLRRDHYLIAALIIDLPHEAGAKPTLRGIGWTHQWVADNHVRTVTVPTQHPSTTLVREVGLTRDDGSCLFDLPPAPTTARALRRSLFDFDVDRETEPVSDLFRTPRPRSQHGEPALARRCRAVKDGSIERCRSVAFTGGLCLQHWHTAVNGDPVFDHRTGDRLWPE